MIQLAWVMLKTVLLFESRRINEQVVLLYHNKCFPRRYLRTAVFAQHHRDPKMVREQSENWLHRTNSKLLLHWYTCAVPSWAEPVEVQVISISIDPIG